MLTEEPQSFASLEDSETHLFILIIFLRNMLMQLFLLPASFCLLIPGFESWLHIYSPLSEPGCQICFEIEEFGDFRRLEWCIGTLYITKHSINFTQYYNFGAVACDQTS